jgi:PAS domain S-box-containing protein
MTLERRIHSTTAFVVLLALVLGILLFLNSSGVRQGLDRMKTSSEIVRMAFLMRTLTDEYLVEYDSRPLAQWLKVNETLGKTIGDVQRDESIDRSLLKELEESYRGVNDIHTQIIQLGVSEDQDQQQKLLRATLAGMMAVRLEELVNTAQRIQRSTQSKTLSRQNLAQLSIVGAFLVMVGLIVLNLYLIKKSILQPLRALAAAGVTRDADDVQRCDNMAQTKTGGLTETFQMLVERIQAVQESLRMETTERAQAQEALQRLNEELETRVLDRTAELTKANRKLQALMDALPVGVSFLDESCQRITGNSYFFAQFELTPDDNISDFSTTTNNTTLSRFARFLRNGRDVGDTELPLQRAVAEKRVIPPMELDVHLPGGRRWIAEASGAPILDEQGNVLGGVAVTVDISERKSAEQALADSEETFRSIFETSAQGILITVPDGRVLRANRTAQEILGMSEHEIIHAARDGITDLSDPRLTLALEERKRTGWFTGELSYRRKDGTIFPVYLSSNLFRNSKGEVFSSIIFQDITERKHMEQELQKAHADLAQSRRLLELILAQAPVGFVYFDRDLRYVHINERLAEMNGIPATAHIGKTVPEMTPALVPFVEAVVAKILATGQPVKNYEFSGETPAMPGIFRYWNENWYPVCDDSGEILGFGAVIEEITERKAAEEALRKSHDELELRVQERTAELTREIEQRKRTEMSLIESEQRFRSVFDNSIDAVFLVRPSDGTVFLANPAASKMFGLSEEEICEGGRGILVDLDDPRVPAFLEERKRKGKAVGEMNCRRSDGTIFPVEISGSIFTDVNGDERSILILRDITERKQAEDYLRHTLADLMRSNADLEHFAYVASHDLQEPLRTVTSSLQMFEKRNKGQFDKNSDQLIDYAVDGAKRMKALIQDLLAYSRVNSQGQSFKAVDMNEILDQSIKNCGSLIKATGTSITYDKMPTVTGDATQLTQLLQNLIGNAVKFAPEQGGKVHVSARENGNEWIFSVKDNGIGIDEKYFEKIFVIFQQLSKKGPSAGTGIGLAIVKKIVERHGGRVWVESEVGVGSTFYFTIPNCHES